jgi:transcriptional regulator with XRE-family HTH domain
MTPLIASNFKKLRENLGFSQEKVGQFLDCTREEISYYETGAREIPLTILERTSDLFGVELIEFFSEEETVGITIAYRADDCSVEDLKQIAQFKKIIKNYQRINRLMLKSEL